VCTLFMKGIVLSMNQVRSFVAAAAFVEAGLCRHVVQDSRSVMCRLCMKGIMHSMKQVRGWGWQPWRV
jgi:hypothetical protein